MTAEEYRERYGTPKAPRGKPEEILQVEVVEWLNALGGNAFIFTHPANERKSKIESIRAFRMGQLSGVADLIFWYTGRRTLAIEMKAPKGSLSDNQRKFRDDMTRLGHPWELCRSLEEVKAAMDKHGIPYRETQAAALVRARSQK